MKSLLSKPFIWIIKIYQLLISPLLPNSCRYVPTCSEYGLQAFKKYGPLKGMYLTVKRLLSCHPWGKHGHDPLP